MLNRIVFYALGVVPVFFIILI